MDERGAGNEVLLTTTARLGNDGKEIKLGTSERSTTRDFIFYENGSDAFSTLTISNRNIEAPQYRIAKGHNRDWLVVTRIEGSGSGYIKRIDDWYSIFSVPRKELSYISQQVLSPGYGDSAANNSEYLNTEVLQISSDDLAIDIMSIYKVCSITPEGDDKDCVDSPEVVHYTWDEDNSEFVLQKIEREKESSPDTESEVIVSEIEYFNVNELITKPIAPIELGRLHPLQIENLIEFPDWADYYVSRDSHVDEIQNLDIDNDNTDETVIFYSCVGCNAPSREIDILKGRKVIFRLSGGRLRLDPIDNEAGFYIYTTMVPAFGEVKVEFRQKEDKTFYVKSQEKIYDEDR